MMSAEAVVQSIDIHLFIYYNNSCNSLWNSHGIRWKLFWEAPRFQPFLLDSIGISRELETKMAEAPANWF